MRKQTVTMLHSETIINTRPLKGVYAYNLSGKLLWLQRLLFWILSKLDCEYQEQFANGRFTHLNIEDVFERVMEYSDNVQSFYSLRPRYLVVGQDIYRDLMSHDFSPSFVRLLVDHDYINSRIHPKMQIYNLELVLVPYMEGMVMLPELPPIAQ